MDVNFKFNSADSNEVVVFDNIFGELPGGAMVANPSYDVAVGTAVGYNSDGALTVIKGYRLVADVAAADTTIKIAKGSGIASGDVIGHGKLAVACTGVDASNDSYDVVTVTMGVVIASDTVLYQAASASTDAATPIYTPVYLTGEMMFADEGDQLIKLVNGANVRKETAPVASEVVELMKDIVLQ